MSEDKTGRGEKPEMAQVLKELGEQAIGRHNRRLATPGLEITTENGKWWFGCPYRSEDEDHWVALLFDAFGTRSQATFRTFMVQLASLCSTAWDKGSEAWYPDEDELVAAVQIVRSAKPRNEAEACLAAQMVAVHVMQMKLAAFAVRNDYPDPRSCAIAAKLARTYATQLETMAKLKGRGSRQRITVRKYSQHEHKHIHLHQGANENGNQPHGPSARSVTVDELKSRTSLPSPDATRNSLPVSRNAGSNALPGARRSTAIRCSRGQA